MSGLPASPVLSVFDREGMAAAQYILINAKPTVEALSDLEALLSSLWEMVARSCSLPFLTPFSWHRDLLVTNLLPSI